MDRVTEAEGVRPGEPPAPATGLAALIERRKREALRVCGELSGAKCCPEGECAAIPY